MSPRAPSKICEGPHESIEAHRPQGARRERAHLLPTTMARARRAALRLVHGRAQRLGVVRAAKAQPGMRIEVMGRLSEPEAGLPPSAPAGAHRAPSGAPPSSFPSHPGPAYATVS